MDNRRVSKAYRARNNSPKVLPYPTPVGLVSRVKRYFLTPPSADFSKQPQQNGNNTNHTALQEYSRIVSDFIVPSANTSRVEPEDPNKILSNFFQEKGSKPLSEVEYEGVMSLLERSRASITLPLPDSISEESTPAAAQTAGPNATFAPYTQTKLRNSSMYDRASTSFATSDYKPTYHTFTENASPNVSLRRVYHFRGLPSPYQTRIKPPKFTSRRASRASSIASLSVNVADISDITNSSNVEPSVSKFKSKTATSLLSILDSNTPTGTSTIAESAASKPLHNPYANNRKRKIPQTQEPSPKMKPTPLNANDISKTILFNKTEVLEDSQKKDLLFGTSEVIPQRNVNEGVVQAEARDNESKAEIASKLKIPTSLPEMVQFSSTTLKEPSSKDPIGLKKSTFSEETLPEGSQTSKFTFGSSESKAPAFSFGKTDSKLSSDDGKSFSFGKKLETSPFKSATTSTTSAQPTDNGIKENQTSKPAFTFGTVNAATKAPETSLLNAKVPETNSSVVTDKSKPFTFGSASILFGEKKQEKAPVFSFNKPNESSSLFGNTSQPAPTLFNFGKQVEDKGTSLFSKPISNGTAEKKLDEEVRELEPSSKVSAIQNGHALNFSKEQSKPSVNSSVSSSTNHTATPSANPFTPNGFDSKKGLENGSEASEFQFPEIIVSKLPIEESLLSEFEQLYQF